MLSGGRGHLLATGIETTMLDDRLTSVRYRNFMSFADEEVELSDLAVLVGPNGSGKSKFVDGLRFLRDALRIGLDAAVTNRGGIDYIRRKQSRDRLPVEIEVEGMASDQPFSYGLSITAMADGEWEVAEERCSAARERGCFRFRRDGSDVTVSGPDGYAGSRVLDSVMPDPKTLTFPLAGVPFRTVLTFLRDMGAYNIYPNALREPQRLMPGLLEDDARNLVSVLRGLRDMRSPAADRIRDALRDLVPGAVNFRVTANGGYAALSLARRSSGRDMWFDASQLSDGTLRMLGILTAIHQRPAPPLIAIEEPELTVHPGAVAVLADELVDAAHRTQTLVTTHSPDLVARMPLDSLRVVEMTAEGTKVGRVSEHQVDAVNDKLFSPGDLIRIEGLRRELKPVN